VPCIRTNHTTAIQSLRGLIFREYRHLASVLLVQGAMKNKAKSLWTGLVIALVALAAGCANRTMPSQSPDRIPAPAPVFTPQTAAASSQASSSRLPLVASWADYRRRAAQIILASNAGANFTGPQPAQWSGIATVTVALNADGSIRAMDLMRGSRISPQVNDLALAAARRVASYGPVSNLPQPWQFNETFLYNDDNKFQLVTIIESR
jgi:hypothetical protein